MRFGLEEGRQYRSSDIICGAQLLYSLNQIVEFGS